MFRYYAIVRKDEGSAFGIEFPDFPCVFSAADEEKDIVAKAIEALQLYFEDVDQYPQPTSYDALVSRTEIKQSLAEGAFLINVPLIVNDTEVVRANVTFERGLLNAIDNAAKTRGLSRSAFLANAAKHEIET
ncbi:type II toxin-antitoxin system HicB family antitoxin [Bartonella tamiae]|uniref:type II toxin-antitoxin system HicB family antitoxin n=1 Tax=Bartonella tamiae TaxID=373638 RepID=UPI00026E77B8|nr:type II toxin-antitoxin system HicB family antitoxin [Bartonella tamiae]EJF92664.1 hypothetical protein MEG_01834 [Bartonella tamiae Th307]